MGTLSGLGDVYAGRTLDLIPTVTASISGERERNPLASGGARINNVNRLEPGLTATYAHAKPDVQCGGQSRLLAD
jgi:hypothetical protein